MGAPLWLVLWTVYLLFNLCGVFPVEQKVQNQTTNKTTKPQTTAFSTPFYLSLFHSFLSRFLLFLFPLLLKLFPFLFLILLLLIASDIIQQWTGIGFIPLFLCFSSFPVEFHEQRHRRCKWSFFFFLMKNFLLTLQRRQSKKVPCIWSRETCGQQAASVAICTGDGQKGVRESRFKSFQVNPSVRSGSQSKSRHVQFLHAHYSPTFPCLPFPTCTCWEGTTVLVTFLDYTSMYYNN